MNIKKNPDTKEAIQERINKISQNYKREMEWNHTPKLERVGISAKDFKNLGNL